MAKFEKCPHQKANAGEQVHFNGIQYIQAINWAVSILRSLKEKDV